MKKFFDRNRLIKSERGQAIVLITFAFIGLLAAVGLVTDTGMLLIEYGKLKRSVDAAAVAAAQEFRPDPNGIPDIEGNRPLNISAMTNAAIGLLQVNQIQNVRDIVIHTCEDTGPDRPELCNPNPETEPINNRKLVEVTAKADVGFGFLRVIGINSAEITVTSIGEAATIDLVLLIDTSGSMAYETGVEDRSASPPDDADTPGKPGPDDNPIECNANDNCEPMSTVKAMAAEFVDSLIYFGYDRVAIVTMTGQTIPNAVRDPETALTLSFGRSDIGNTLENLKVFQPRRCAGPDGKYDFDPGECLLFIGGDPGTYQKPICPLFQNQFYVVPEIGRDYPTPEEINPASCPSSNIGGMLYLANEYVYEGGDPDITDDDPRPDSLWVTVLLASGPANASTPTPDDEDDYPNGYCPPYTWFFYHDAIPAPKPRWCRDASPGNERPADVSLVPFTNPYDDSETIDISYYDAEDYARDMADALAAKRSGDGVTIYTIGMGQGVSTMPDDDWTPASVCPPVDRDYDPDTTPVDCGEAEYLLTYIAQEAGDEYNGNIKHGDYYYAKNTSILIYIFETIAQNITTKISQ